jgi:hypothetical protein
MERARIRAVREVAVRLNIRLLRMKHTREGALQNYFACALSVEREVKGL